MSERELVDWRAAKALPEAVLAPRGRAPPGLAMISPDLLRSPQVLAKLGALHGLKARRQEGQRKVQASNARSAPRAPLQPC